MQKVRCILKNEYETKEFDSLVEASQYLKVSPQNIYSSIHMGCKCSGYYIIRIGPGDTRQKCDREEYLRRHDPEYPRLYGVWYRMQHCVSDVCKEWWDYEPFRTWALSHGYDSTLRLWRFDSSQSYSPENCTWVTHTEVGRALGNSRRGGKPPILITANGETHSLPEWSNITGIPYQTLHYRYRAGLESSEILRSSKYKSQRSDEDEVDRRR